MKISVDISPEEMRKLLGWPDVQAVQEQAMKQILEQMSAGTEGYDPMSLMQPFFTQSASSMEQFQKTMGDLLTSFGNKNSDSGKAD